MATVTELTAYKYSDNYRVESESEPVNVFGCEHNQAEADALARYLSSTKGIKVRVVKNGRAEVAEAKKYRPTPMRCPLRDEAFEAMGIYR